MKGKLATRGRLVTRDNEGQEEGEKRRKKAKASVRPLERDSGRARIAPLPIRGTTIPRIGRTEAAVSIEQQIRGVEDRPRIASIETAPVDNRRHHRRHRYHHRRHRHHHRHHHHRNNHHHHRHRHRHRIFERDYRRRIVEQGLKWRNEEEEKNWRGDRCRIKIDGSSISRLFGIATLVAVAVALFVPIASPVPLSGTGPRHEDDLHRFTGLEDVYEDVFREEDRATTSRSSDVLDETELDIIRRSIARGLGLERIPDPSKVSRLVSLPPSFPPHSPLFLSLSPLKLTLRTITIDTGRKIKYPRSRRGVEYVWSARERKVTCYGIEICDCNVKNAREVRKNGGGMKRTREKDGREMAGTVQRGGWSAGCPTFATYARARAHSF